MKSSRVAVKHQWQKILVALPDRQRASQQTRDGLPLEITLGIGRFWRTHVASSVAWLRLFADGRFELTAFNHDLVPGSGCRKRAMLYARGQFQFTVGDYNSNNLILQPQVSTLIEGLTECEADNGTRRRSLPLESLFFYASLGRTVNNEEVFEIRCLSTPEERSEWQFLICPSGGSDFSQLYSRRP